MCNSFQTWLDEESLEVVLESAADDWPEHMWGVMCLVEMGRTCIIPEPATSPVTSLPPVSLVTSSSSC